jgi:hypothetical protein
MIDLDELATIAGLPIETATILTFRSALALQRRHRPGVRLLGEARQEPIDEELQWREQKPQRALHAQEDFNRVTEEGAEALALAVAGSKCSWRVVRRLQSRLAEGADWLLVDPATKRKVVLEVGGTDEGDLDPLLARKLKQAKHSPFSERGTPAACAVGFLEPGVLLWSGDGPR